MVSLAKLSRRFDQRFEYRLQIKGRAADYLEHVGGGGLLLERLAQLIEQASVLDGDDRLVGETLHELDVLVGEGPHLLTVDADDAHQLLFIQHWYDQQSPSASKLGESASVRATLHAMYAWAIQEGMAEFNPVTGTSRAPEKSRDRVLSAKELRAVWNALPDDHFGAIIKLLALTGARANEIAALRWDEVHDNMIVLPAERTKNSRSHVIPLSEPARAIINAQDRRANTDGKTRELVFGFGEGAFAGWGKCRERLNERITNETGKAQPHW